MEQIPGEVPLERTQSVPSGERTQAVPAVDRTTSMPAPAPPEESQEEKDRRLAIELSRRGIPSDEVARLMALGRGEAPAPAKRKGAAVLPSPPVLPPSASFEPKPTITLPEFREHTTQQRIEADRILTNVSISRRRGLYKQAEQEVRKALELVPRDAAALELYGDILQGLGRVDDAAFCYQRALEADPKRGGAERKYAELALLQNREIEILRQEYIPRNPFVAILMSAVAPGAGQVYNGDSLKGVLIAALFAVCIYVLGWTQMGFPGSRSRVSGSLTFFLIAAVVLYIYAVADANFSAKRGARQKSGWEV